MKKNKQNPDMEDLENDLNDCDVQAEESASATDVLENEIEKLQMRKIQKNDVLKKLRKILSMRYLLLQKSYCRLQIICIVRLRLKMMVTMSTLSSLRKV